MSPSKKNRKTDLSQIVAAIMFIILLLGLVILGIAYEPGDQFSNSFFDNVANAIKWGD